MQTYNELSSVIFDFLLAPFGHDLALFDLVVLAGGHGGCGSSGLQDGTSNQKRHRPGQERRSACTCWKSDSSRRHRSGPEVDGTILVKNALYIGHNLLPMAVMLAPMVAVMVQLVAHYAYAPSRPGSVELLHLQLDPTASVSSRDVSLALPTGVSLDAPAVRTADGQVFWRVRAERPGDHVLRRSRWETTFSRRAGRWGASRARFR